MHLNFGHICVSLSYFGLRGTIRGEALVARGIRHRRELQLLYLRMTEGVCRISNNALISVNIVEKEKRVPLNGLVPWAGA